jgi:hypothetical protein
VPRSTLLLRANREPLKRRPDLSCCASLFHSYCPANIMNLLIRRANVSTGSELAANGIPKELLVFARRSYRNFGPLERAHVRSICFSDGVRPSPYWADEQSRCLPTSNYD